MASVDRTGLVYGDLLVIGPAETRIYGGKKYRVWRCRCKCGQVVDICVNDLSRQTTCMQCAIIKRAKHGRTATRAYRTWDKMKQRCLNSAAPEYRYYGGRGIAICDKWLEFTGFFDDMGEPPVGHTIERIDVNGNYCKENCKWIPGNRQACNTTRTIWVTLGGEKMCLMDACRKLGVRYGRVRHRIASGWDPLEALRTPSRQASKHDTEGN